MSGRLPTVPNLQVMSPNTPANNNEDGQSNDVEMQGPSQGLELAAYLQNQSTAQARSSSHEGPADTPVPRALREEIIEVVDAHVRWTENEEHAYQEKNQTMASQLRRAIGDQRRQFENAAERFKEQAEDDREVEVAKTKADARAAIQERDDRLANEYKVVTSLRKDLSNVENVANNEYSQRNSIIHEANQKYNDMIGQATKEHDRILSQAKSKSSEDYDNLKREAETHVK